MRRRGLLAAVPALAAWPAFAQSMPAVGFLHPGKVDSNNLRLATFAEGLRTKGYVDGKTVSIVVRAAEFDADRLARYAAELVDATVDVIFAVGSNATQEARTRTSTIPIVAMDLEADPVASGFVNSLAHPGGNITGLYFDFAEFSGKWLEIMGEIVPGLTRAAVIWDPATGRVQNEAATTAARQRGLRLEVISCPQPTAIFRQGGEIVAKVLAGTKPSDLPVERPTRILLAINMKTAAALDVTIPPVILLRADTVIE